MKNKVNCMKCGIIDKYKIIPSPYKIDDDDFKYSKCKRCGNEQPMCLGIGCIDAIEVACPVEESKKCNEIIEKIRK